MTTLMTYTRTIAVAIAASAAMALVPAAAAARDPYLPYRQPVEFAVPAPKRVQLPAVNRGTSGVLPSDADLESFETELAGR